MHWRAGALVVAVSLAAAGSLHAADRQWRTGACTKVDVSRQMVDFGPGQSPFGGPRAPTHLNMKALAEVRIYVIETADLHIEAKDVAPVGRHTVDIEPGEPVTFALEKNTLYVRDPLGGEHKLQVVKKKAK